MDRQGGIIIGALIVLVLLFVATPIGLIALAVVIIAAVVLLATENFTADSSSRDRPCPRCGEPVQNGVLDCPHCAFDFRTIGATVPPGGADQGAVGPPATPPNRCD